LALLLMWALAACQHAQKPQRAMFDEAEAAFRNGHYDAALERYEAFQKAFPDHPLAPLARQRVSNIEREFNAVMDRKAGAKPIYLRPVGPEESAQVSGGVVHALPVAPTPAPAASPMLRSVP
jgi:hypothetical protein